MMQFLGILVAAGAVAGTLYLLWRPYWVFVLILTMFPLEQLLQVYVPAFARQRTWFNYLVGGLAVMGVVLRLSKREPIGLGARNPVSIMVFLIYVLFSAGVLYSLAPTAAMSSFTTGLPYIILLVVFLPLLIVDIFEFRKLLGGLMFLGSVIAVLIMVNPNTSFISGRLFLDLGMLSGIDRYGSPLALGELGGMIALIAALVKPERPSQVFAILRITAFITGFGLAIGSGSRGQVLAAGICGVIFYPMARRLTNPKQFFINVIGFGVLCVGIYMTFKLFVGDQNRERWDVVGMLRDTTLRLEMAFDLFNVYLNSPTHWLLGLGTNAYASIARDGVTIYVHNVAAEMLCEHGIVGAILFAMIAILTFKYGKRLWKLYSHDPSMRATVAVLLAICTYALFLALKQGSISYPAPFFWWMVLAKLYKREEHALAHEGAAEESAGLRNDVAREADLIDEGYALGYSS